MRATIFAVLLIGGITCLQGQPSSSYSDQMLTATFKVFRAADFELAHHILPFLRKRFETELSAPSSFSNPYDSLSQYVAIRVTPDSMLKTYCWDERNGSCCYTSATFAQYKTDAGEVKYLDLEAVEGGDEEMFITDVQLVAFNQKPHYLILGWGTCCGGKQYETARLFEIRNDSLHKCDSVFEGEPDLYVGANRGDEIGLRYDTEHKELSYYRYVFDEKVGFYKDEKKLIRWKLTHAGFERVDP